MYKSTTGSTSATAGKVKFASRNDGGTAMPYAHIEGKAYDDTASSEDGNIQFVAKSGGSDVGMMELGYDGNSFGMNLYTGTASGSGLNQICTPNNTNFYLAFGSNLSYSEGGGTVKPPMIYRSGSPDPNDSGGDAQLFIQSQDDLILMSGEFSKNASGNDMVFKTGGTARASSTERMRILGSDGNVGIGTSAPSAKLHVDGDIRIDNGHTLDFDSKGYIDVNVDSGTGDDLFYIRRRGSSNEISFNTTTASAPVIDSPNGTLDFQAASTPVAQFKDDTGIIMQDNMGIKNNVAPLTNWTPGAGAGGVFQCQIAGYSKIQLINTNSLTGAGATVAEVLLPTGVAGMEYMIIYGSSQANITTFRIAPATGEAIYNASSVSANVVLNKTSQEVVHLVCAEAGAWTVVAHN